MTLMLPETVELFSVPVVGQVKETISASRPGRIAAIASTWNARFYNPNCQTEISPGETVTVVGRHGIMLLVVPSGHTLPPLSKSARTLEDWRSQFSKIIASSHHFRHGGLSTLNLLRQLFPFHWLRF